MKTTEEEKADFLKAYLETLESAIMKNIDKMPNEWDGWELRQYVADKAEELCYMKMDKKRMKEYKNTVLVEDL